MNAMYTAADVRILAPEATVPLAPRQLCCDSLLMIRRTPPENIECDPIHFRRKTRTAEPRRHGARPHVLRARRMRGAKPYVVNAIRAIEGKAAARNREKACGERSGADTTCVSAKHARTPELMVSATR